MASILDSLLFNSGLPPSTEPPLPSPNPLRIPQPAPTVNGGVGSLLGTIFQAPEFSWMFTDTDSPSLRKAKAARNEAEARQYYNAQGVQMPLPERGARPDQGNQGAASASSSDDEEADDSAEGDADVPLPERSPFSGGGAGAPGAGPSRGPDGSVRTLVPHAAPVADPFRAMMLQLGLSLLTPSWGDSLSQIGQAVGQGMAAGGRAQQLNRAEEQRVEAKADKDEDRALKARKTEAEIGRIEADTDDIRSGESSRSRRLRGKQPTVIDEAAAAAGLGPKGKAYLAQRIKTLNQEDLLGTEDADPVAKFNTIIEEAKKLDAPSAPAKAPNVGGTETTQGVPVVKSLAEAKKLPSGTKFMIERNGKLMEGVVP